MNLLKIGDRIINLDTVSSALYTQNLLPPNNTDNSKVSTLCTVYLGVDDYEQFYDEEADQVWAYLVERATDITPDKQLNAAA